MAMRAVASAEGSESIVLRLEGAPWAAVPKRLLEDERLDMPARVLGAWICGRPDGWTFHPSHIMRVLTMGKDKYQAARRQLIAAGYLEISTGRTVEGKFVTPQWRFRFEPAPMPQVGKHDAEARQAGAGLPSSGLPAARLADAGEAGYLPKRLVARKKTTNSTEPPPARALGSRLAALLDDASAVARVNEASFGASDAQLALAEQVVVRLKEQGQVRSVTALAVKMAKLAALGAVQAPTIAPSAADAQATWARRESAEGQHLMHPTKGRHTVLPGARAWLREDGQTVSGANGLKLWEKVEAGILQLRSE